MRQTLIDAFDSLPIGLQNSLSNLIEGLALENTVKRANEELKRKQGILSFEDIKKGGIRGKA